MGQPLLCSRYWHLFLPHLRRAVGSTGHHQPDLSIAMANCTCRKELRRDRNSTAAPGAQGAWECCLQALCYTGTPPKTEKIPSLSFPSLHSWSSWAVQQDSLCLWKQESGLGWELVQPYLQGRLPAGIEHVPHGNAAKYNG